MVVRRNVIPLYVDHHGRSAIDYARGAVGDVGDDDDDDDDEDNWEDVEDDR